MLALPSVVRQEKVHQNLLEGVEHFDKATMKPTQTQEKNPLPDPEGRWHGGGLETAGYWEYWRWLAGKFIFMFLEQGSAKSGTWDLCGLMALSCQFAAAYSVRSTIKIFELCIFCVHTQITFY